jgi:hypothetical protein
MKMKGQEEEEKGFCWTDVAKPEPEVVSILIQAQEIEEI